MTKKLILLWVLVCALSVAAFAQVIKPPQPKGPQVKTPQLPQTTAPQKTTPRPTPAEQTAPTGPEAVRAAFNKLLDGIRRADVKMVTDVYWNSPQLNLFNYNGSVTKGWEQMRKNRESSYPEIKDVKLEVRDVNVTMLGLNAALVTCAWTQSQNYKGAPETASGRMTLVFRKVGTAWKAIHLHSSPDQPNPAVIPPSEQQQPVASPSPTPSPTPE